MCGIVGTLTAEPNGKGGLDRDKFMKLGLILDTVRGLDSTGAYYTRLSWDPDDPAQERTAGYYKSLNPGPLFVEEADWHELVKDSADYRYWIGHNRAATMGAIDVDSAHPFQEGPVTLVHNGTLTTTSSLPLSMFELGREVTVDSHALCHNFAEGEVEDASYIIARIQGAFALVWHDARDDSLNFVRNHERPFHIAKDKDSDTLFMMSEAELLWYVSQKARIKLEEIIQPRPYEYLKWLPGQLTPEVKKVEKVYPYYGGYGGYNHGAYYGSQRRSQPGKSTEQSRPKAQTAPVPHARFTNHELTKVWVGGRTRPIPLKSQVAVLDAGLDLEKPYTFVTAKAPKVDGSRRMVEGFLLPDGQDAVVYGIDLSQWREHSNNDWAVLPVSAYTKGGEDIVVCKRLSFFTPARSSVVRTKQEDYEVEDSGMTELSDDFHPPVPWEASNPWSDDLYLRGPAGTYVPMHIFTQLTADGCVQCQRPIAIDEDEDVEWLNDGKAVMCPDCIEDWEEWERKGVSH